MGEAPQFIKPKDALIAAKKEIAKATPASGTLLEGAHRAAYPYDEGVNDALATEAAITVASAHQQAMNQKGTQTGKK